MATRRNVEFDPKRREDGRWFCRVYVDTDPVTGNPIQRMHTCSASATTKDAAIAELREWWANEQGNPTLREAMDDYIAYRRRHEDLAPNTVDKYRGDAGRIARQKLARAHVRDILQKNVRDMYDRMLEQGSAHGGPLSASTIGDAHTFLKGVSAWLMGQGYVVNDFMLGVRPPTRRRTEAYSLEEWEQAALRDWIKATLADESDVRARAMAMGIYLGFYFGLRVGEACGVRRCDVNLRRGTLNVSGQVTTEEGKLARSDRTKGRRRRNLPMTDEDARVLRDYMDWQERTFEVGPTTTLVSLDGGLVPGGRLSAALRSVAGGLGLSGSVHFHTLRHTHATTLLYAGVPVQEVSARLGHADVATTLRYYGHVMLAHGKTVAEAFRKEVESL